MNSHASFWEAVKGALHSLRGSKLRSFLTLLGIILATTTLIAVMSVISGMDVYIAQNVSSMGADGYRVQRIVMMGFDPKKYMEMLRRNPQLSREEYEFLRQRLTLTKEIGISAGRGVTVHRGTVTPRPAEMPISLVNVRRWRRNSYSSRLSWGLRRSISMYFLGSKPIITMRCTRYPSAPILETFCAI